MSLPIFLLYLALVTAIVTLFAAVGCWAFNVRKGRRVYDRH